MKKLTLCDPQTQHSCPTVEISDKGEVVLRDDLDGKVVLTAEQWEMLRRLMVQHAL